MNMEWIITSVSLKSSGYGDNKKVVGITVEAEQKDAFAKGIGEYADASLSIDLPLDRADQFIVGSYLQLELTV